MEIKNEFKISLSVPTSLRNEIFGIERSFLEAEYHCRDGYTLKRKSKRKTFIKNRNLVCKNRRWIGLRPACKRSESKTKSSLSEQQCDELEASQCEHLCIKRENSTEATCYCHKGFRLIGARCFGKLKTNFFACPVKNNKNFFPLPQSPQNRY